MNAFNLLIVESPAKCKTISKFLKNTETGSWKVMATMGHILNLPKDQHGIEIQNNAFIGTWIFEKGKKKLVQEITDVAKKADKVFIATDPDREGEKIALDLVVKTGLSEYYRVTFNEITRAGVLNALRDNVRLIDNRITEAQRARRYIDREVGYPVSQVMRAHFEETANAFTPHGIGRVSAPALHILHETEKRIEAFVSEPYQQLIVDYVVNGIPFRATNRTKFKLETIEQLQETMHLVRTNEHIVEEYKPVNADVSPFPPLTTARLQRGAFYLFGFEPQHTMALAQKLYEFGYITYMRTDSYHIAETAIHEMIRVLNEHFGPEHTMSIRREFGKQKKKTQDAHEAVRPSHFETEYFPKHINKIWVDKGEDGVLGADHLKLYEFIFYRTLATQMANAVYDRTQVVINVAGVKFYAQANHQIYSGWEMLGSKFLKASDSNEADDWKERDVQIPSMVIGDSLPPVNIDTIDKKTRQPDRYGIGRFVTTLDDAGIARPSTLDTIIPNLKDKEYILIRNGMLYITDLGKEVDKWVVKHCPWLADREHAKELEEKLDRLENGEMSNADDLIHEYHTLVEQLKDSLGILVHRIPKPTAGQIEYAQQLAEKHQIPLPDDVFETKEKTAQFINKHKPTIVEVGKCPSCKTGKVVMLEKNFGCNAYKEGCTFTIWKNRIDGFLDKFQVEHDEALVLKLIEQALKKKPMTLSGLVGQNGTFSAKIIVKKDPQFGWGLGFDFNTKPL